MIGYNILNSFFLLIRGVAQPGSASALGAEGRVFESFRPDQERKLGGIYDRSCNISKS